MIFELVYTSVPRGLRPGSKGYCTVLTTEGIPAALQDRMEGLCGYRHLFDPGSAQNPVNFMHHKIQIAGNTWHILSRIADAGSDYSQRSNLLAHHVAISQDEISRLACAPATLMKHPSFFMTVWNGDPRRVSENETRLRLVKLSSSVKVAKEWERVTGDAGYAGVLANTTAESGNRSIDLVYPLGIDILSIIEEASDLLPKHEQWQTTFNTFFTKSIEEIKWRFYCNAAPESKPFTGSAFDLTKLINAGTQIDATNPLVIAARTGKQAAGRSQTKVESTFVENQRPTKLSANKPVKKQDDEIDIFKNVQQNLRQRGEYRDPAFIKNTPPLKTNTPPLNKAGLPPSLKSGNESLLEDLNDLNEVKAIPAKENLQKAKLKVAVIALSMTTLVLLCVVIVGSGYMFVLKTDVNTKIVANNEPNQPKEAANINTVQSKHKEDPGINTAESKQNDNSKPEAKPKAPSEAANQQVAAKSEDNNKSVPKDMTKTEVSSHVTGSTKGTPPSELKPAEAPKTEVSKTDNNNESNGNEPSRTGPAVPPNEDKEIVTKIELVKATNDLYYTDLSAEFDKAMKDRPEGSAKPVFVSINLTALNITVDKPTPNYLSKSSKTTLKLDVVTDNALKVLKIRVPRDWEVKDKNRNNPNSLAIPTNFCIHGKINDKDVTVAMYEPIKIELSTVNNELVYALKTDITKGCKILPEIKLFSHKSDPYYATEIVAIDNSNISLVFSPDKKDFPEQIVTVTNILKKAGKKDFVLNDEYTKNTTIVKTDSSIKDISFPNTMIIIGVNRYQTSEGKKTIELSNDKIYTIFPPYVYMFIPAFGINPVTYQTSKLFDQFDFNGIKSKIQDFKAFYGEMTKRVDEDVKNGNIDVHYYVLSEILKFNKGFCDITKVSLVGPEVMDDNAKMNRDKKIESNKEFLSKQPGVSISTLLKEFYKFQMNELDTNLNLLINHSQGFVIYAIDKQKDKKIRLPVAIYNPTQANKPIAPQSPNHSTNGN